MAAREFAVWDSKLPGIGIASAFARERRCCLQAGSGRRRSKSSGQNRASGCRRRGRVGSGAHGPILRDTPGCASRIPGQRFGCGAVIHTLIEVALTNAYNHKSASGGCQWICTSARIRRRDPQPGLLSPGAELRTRQPRTKTCSFNSISCASLLGAGLVRSEVDNPNKGPVSDEISPN